MAERISVEVSKNPNFLGCWKLDDPTICDRVVEFFECHQNAQRAGIAGDGSVREAIKKSTDMTITPRDLEDQDFAPVLAFVEQLQGLLKDYLTQWEYLGSFLPRVHIGRFNIQRYDLGGHYYGLHAERTTIASLPHMLAWMGYLNDVEEGGETEFPYYGVKMTPEKGKVLIWPSDWTHAHMAQAVKKGKKYIITGWMDMPHDLILGD